MFYQGTVVGCCAIMYEERKGGSREASSKGNKQRQTGLCLPVALLNQAGGLLQENQQTPTQPKQTYPSRTLTQQMVTRLFCCSFAQANLHTLTHCPRGEQVCMSVFIYICVSICVCADLNASVSRCRPLLFWPRRSPCQLPSTRRDRQGALQRCRVDRKEQLLKRKGEEEKRMKGRE